MKHSIIHSTEKDYKTSIKEVFEKIYRSLTENDDKQYPSIKLRYMVDDYEELLLQENTK